MIGYRFLPPAEDEMAEAALFYDAASTGLATHDNLLLSLEAESTRALST